jgi:hypothetical protein
MGLRAKLKKGALEVGQRAVERLLADEKRAMAVAGAFGRVQKGKQALDRGQEELMHALSLATKGDYKAVSKQLAGLKRRLRELEEKLGDLDAGTGGAGAKKG